MRLIEIMNNPLLPDTLINSDKVQGSVGFAGILAGLHSIMTTAQDFLGLGLVIFGLVISYYSLKNVHLRNKVKRKEDKLLDIKIRQAEREEAKHNK